MRKFRQNKLWRDKAPNIMRAQGSIIHVEQLDDAAYDNQLRTKLLEEAHEVNCALSREEIVAELADVYEVIDALLTLHTISHDELIASKEQRKAHRGGFFERQFVTVAEHPQGSFGERYCLNDAEKYPEIIE